MYSFNEVSSFDPDLAKAMDDELARQRSHIELIASENLVSKAVMAAMGRSEERRVGKECRSRKGQRSYSAVNMPMFSHILVHRLT